jgi:hypothetical protein
LRKPASRLVNRLPITKAHVNLEKDGVPVSGIMDADEMEDYAELRDSKVNAQIRQSNLDVQANRTRPAEALLQV